MQRLALKIGMAVLFLGLSYLNANAAGVAAACAGGETLTWSTPPSAHATGVAALVGDLGCQSPGTTFTITAYGAAGCIGASVGAVSNNTKVGTAASGLINFATFTYVTAGIFYYRLAAPGFAQSACVGPITITPGTATKLNIGTQPSATGTINTALAQQPIVSVMDAYNNVVTSNNSSVITLTPFTDVGCTAAATGVLMNTTATAASGVATLGGLKYSKIETIYLKASSAALTTACSTSIAIAVPSGPGTIQSCAQATNTTGYVVDGASSYQPSGAACAADEFLLYDTVNNVTMPVCVDAQCGANARTCTTVGPNGQDTNHFCAHCNLAGCQN